ncbi:MAG: hypothetical protein CSA33_02020 [Desulfobulbus propionicus]|nr:MAG: hypothetical protein CSA33_02020 [Desulfobulbus propionicus]
MFRWGHGFMRVLAVAHCRALGAAGSFAPGSGKRFFAKMREHAPFVFRPVDNRCRCHVGKKKQRAEEQLRISPRRNSIP